MQDIEIPIFHDSLSSNFGIFKMTQLIAMLTKSFTLLFYLKKRNNNVKGELPIYMRFDS